MGVNWDKFAKEDLLEIVQVSFHLLSRWRGEKLMNRDSTWTTVHRRRGARYHLDHVLRGVRAPHGRDPRSMVRFPPLRSLSLAHLPFAYSLWSPTLSLCKFSEVKGPGDHLSETQKVWIDVLLGAGVEVEVCRVVTSEEKDEMERKETEKSKGKGGRKRGRTVGSEDAEEEEE